MVAAAIYLLVKTAVQQGKLTQAEALVKDMEERYGAGQAGSVRVKRYKSFAYYLLGRAFYDQSQGAAKDAH